MPDILTMCTINSNLTFIALNLHRVVDSKAQQDNSNMQIQSPGTEVGRHHGEAIRENDAKNYQISFSSIHPKKR